MNKGDKKNYSHFRVTQSNLRMNDVRSHRVAEDTLPHFIELSSQSRCEVRRCKMHVFGCPMPHGVEMIEYWRDCCLRGTGRQGRRGSVRRERGGNISMCMYLLVVPPHQRPLPDFSVLGVHPQHLGVLASRALA